jgi:poly(3-hydroxybutyrate) depolymerase
MSSASTGGSGSGGGPGSSGGGSSGGSGASDGGGSSGGSGDGGAVGSAGCGKTTTLTFGAVPNENPSAAPGSGQGVGKGDGGWLTIQSSGQTRGFAMRLPDNYEKNRPYWLIFGFHWNGGTSDQIDNGGTNGDIMAYFGLQSPSNDGAIFVAPQGLGNGWANSGGQDLQFVDDMVRLIEDSYCVDTTHLFATGFSYGGGMSYAIACARAKVFRGVAIYEGAQLSGCEGGNDPIAYWQMVGLTDNTCPVSLATPLRDRFVKNNGCTAQNPPQPPQPPPYLNPGGHVCTDYGGCSSGHPLRWCVHQSGHGSAVVDGTSDLYNSCATPPKSCSSTCPCSWVPQDVWSWMTSF